MKIDSSRYRLDLDAIFCTEGDSLMHIHVIRTTEGLLTHPVIG